MMFREILFLDGYGIYVWPAFGFTLAVLVWMGVSTRHRLRRNEALLARLQKIRGDIAANESGAEYSAGQDGRPKDGGANPQGGGKT